MSRLRVVLLLAVLLLAGSFPPGAFAQFVKEARLDSPQPGEAVQGVVAVTGNTDSRGFLSYELAFAFEEDASLTWFVIVESEQAVEDGTLGEWDTTTLTDGTYSLRLTVEIEGEEAVVIYSAGIRVRNYSPVETNTPAPTNTPDPGQTATLTATSPPATPTDFAPNPAAFSSTDVRTALVGGMLFAGVVFALFIWYSRSKAGP